MRLKSETKVLKQNNLSEGDAAKKTILQTETCVKQCFAIDKFGAAQIELSCSIFPNPINEESLLSPLDESRFFEELYLANSFSNCLQTV